MEHRDQPDILCYRRQVFRLLDQMNDKDRLVVNLHDVEGYSVKEIEILIDTPAGTIKSRLHRARKKLREGLNVEPSYTDQRFHSIETGGEHYEL